MTDAIPFSAPSMNPPELASYTCRDCGGSVTKYAFRVLFMRRCAICDWLYSLDDADPAKPKLRAEMVRLRIIAR